MNTVQIDSHMTLGSGLPYATQDEIKREPMLHRATAQFALENGGPLTRSFLLSLQLAWSADILVDSRVHMLMPGMWPCIPGWHHDDVPRSRVGRTTQLFYARV
jgi:hypothetical protein